MDFPSLQGQGLIGVDCETYDPDLKAEGPGEMRSGRVVGVSVATEAGFAEYYPVGHEPGGNLPQQWVAEWLSRELSTPCPKVGSKLLYDLPYLAKMGVATAPPYWDIQVAEPLLDENKFKYGLDVLAREYLGVGKLDEELDTWLIEHFGKKNPKGSIWRAPWEIVRPYAIEDAKLPIKIFRKQEVRLRDENLWDLFLMESRLIPMLVAMRKRGVRVDVRRAEEMLGVMTGRQEEAQAELNHMVSAQVDVWAAATIAPVFDALGLPYPLTPKTKKASITASLLQGTVHPACEKILEIRRLDKMRGTFLQGSILDKHVQSRIHCQFKQVKSEVGGTVSGRFSSAQPNLQFIPVRTDEGKLMRSIFLPDEDCDWYKADYSQIEYRLIVHDAATLDLPKAREVAQLYWDDPDTDFHRVVAEMTGLDRGRAKTVNFGLAYGEGVEKLCRSLGLTRAEGESLLMKYHRDAPFIKKLSGGLMAQAASTGRITTLLGRIRHFDTWAIRKWGQEDIFLRHRVPGSQRAFTHTALNARIQGSAADIMKKAMVDAWESDAILVLGAPHLTVHDELDFSVPRTVEGRQAMDEVKRIMESTVKLMVPLQVDVASGIDWGRCK